jgi:hypothetical protein
MQYFKERALDKKKCKCISVRQCRKFSTNIENESKRIQNVYWRYFNIWRLFLVIPEVIHVYELQKVIPIDLWCKCNLCTCIMINECTRAVQKVRGLRLCCSHLLICVYDFTRDIYENMSLLNSEKINKIFLQIKILWQLQITRGAQSGARWWRNKPAQNLFVQLFNVQSTSNFRFMLFKYY